MGAVVMTWTSEYYIWIDGDDSPNSKIEAALDAAGISYEYNRGDFD